MPSTQLAALECRVAELEAANRALADQLADLRRTDGYPGVGAVSTHASHDTLFAAVEKTRMPMIVTDPNQHDDPIIFANRAFQELCGYSSEELLGRNCRFLQGEGTDPGHVAALRKGVADGTDVVVDIVNYRRDGTMFVNELYVSSVFDRDGRLLYHFGSQVDVTDVKQNFQRLQESEARQRAIFDSAVDFAVAVMDHEGNVTDWNIGAERITGWPVSEIMGKPLNVIFTPEDVSAGRIEVERQMALAEGSAPDERWHLHKDGSRFYASGRMMPLLADDGKHIGFVKIFTDRTGEQTAKRALQRAEEIQDRHRAVLNAIEVGFCIIEMMFDTKGQPYDYRFLDANEAFDAHTGLTGAVGKTMRDIAPEMEQHWFDAYGAVAKTGIPVHFENRAEHLGGRWFDVRAMSVGLPKQHLVAILFSDATGRKSDEEQRAVLNSELAHRLKNNLALVSSIVTQTLRGAPDVPSARAVLSQRIQALSHAHDVLMTGYRDAATVDAIVRGASSIHDVDGRIHLVGPEVELSAGPSLSLSLIVHELSTNAVKYGALSVPEGQVNVSWSADVDADTGRTALRLEWREVDGPLVTVPDRKSFGTKLIERGLSGLPDCTAELVYASDGLVCRITGTLDERGVPDHGA